jgi:hypothetical protein
MSEQPTEAWRIYDPLDRSTFNAIAYNAVGRSSEINTYPALHLTHSTGNSGWSVGIVQWDFGQPGRGDKVDELLSGYRQWAEPRQQFSEEQERDLKVRLQTRGQVGNALTDAERDALNGYLRSDPGREFVSGLNEQQINRKWNNIGEPLSEIEWLRDLRRADPAEATEIVTQVMKLYNQNENRGRRLIDHLSNYEMSSEQTSNWIGNEGIQGLNSNAQRAILSGRDNAITGARLMNSLEQGTGELAQAWQWEIHERGNASLYNDFSTSPQVQLLDGMFRNPGEGIDILARESNPDPGRSITIQGINASARLEMSRIQMSRDNVLTITSPGGNIFTRTPEGWSRDGVLIPAEGQEQPAVRPAPAGPDNPGHPDYSRLQQIRSHVRVLDQSVGREYDDGSERFSRSLLAACRGGGDANFGRGTVGIADNVLDRVDHVVIGNDGQRAFAVQGDLNDPAHRRADVDISEARQTSVEYSDHRLELANRQVTVEQQSAHPEVQQQEGVSSGGPKLGQ